jgi:hypothetical protein
MGPTLARRERVPEAQTHPLHRPEPQPDLSDVAEKEGNAE